MVEGLENEEIAEQLMISPHTVQSHVSNALAKAPGAHAHPVGGRGPRAAGLIPLHPGGTPPLDDPASARALGGAEAEPDGRRSAPAGWAVALGRAGALRVGPALGDLGLAVGLGQLRRLAHLEDVGRPVPELPRDVADGTGDDRGDPADVVAPDSTTSWTVSLRVSSGVGMYAG